MAAGGHDAGGHVLRRLREQDFTALHGLRRRLPQVDEPFGAVRLYAQHGIAIIAANPYAAGQLAEIGRPDRVLSLRTFVNSGAIRLAGDRAGVADNRTEDGIAVR